MKAKKARVKLARVVVKVDEPVTIVPVYRQEPVHTVVINPVYRRGANRPPTTGR